MFRHLIYDEEATTEDWGKDSFQLMVVGELEIRRERRDTDLCLTSYPKLETTQMSNNNKMDNCTEMYSPNEITHHHEKEQTTAKPHGD